MGTGRREVKVVAGIALLTVLVAVAAAVMLSVNLSAEADEQRSVASDLRKKVAAMTERAERAEDEAEDLGEEYADLQGGFKQCQRAIELSNDVWELLYEYGPDLTQTEIDELDALAEKADKATVVCLGRQIDLVDTY